MLDGLAAGDHADAPRVRVVSWCLGSVMEGGFNVLDFCKRVADVVGLDVWRGTDGGEGGGGGCDCDGSGSLTSRAA